MTDSSAASLGYGKKNQLEENRYQEYLFQKANGHSTSQNHYTGDVSLPEVPKPRFAASLGFGRRNKGYNTYAFADAPLKAPLEQKVAPVDEFPLPIGLGYGKGHRSHASYLIKMSSTKPDPKESGETQLPTDPKYLPQGLGYGPWHKDYFAYKYAHDRTPMEKAQPGPAVHKDNLPDHLDEKLLPSALGYGPWHRDYFKFRDSHQRPVALHTPAVDPDDKPFPLAAGLGFGETHQDHYSYLSNYGPTQPDPYPSTIDQSAPVQAKELTTSVRTVTGRRRLDPHNQGQAVANKAPSKPAQRQSDARLSVKQQQKAGIAPFKSQRTPLAATGIARTASLDKTVFAPQAVAQSG